MKLNIHVNTCQIVDAQGLLCPFPLLKAKQALKTIKPGECIQVLCTDPSSKIDFEVFVRQTGHKMLEFKEEKEYLVFLVQKKE